MSVRIELERKIARKRREIAALHAKIRDAEVYTRALMEALELLPKEPELGKASSILRPNGAAAEARQAILARGAAVHIDALLAAMGKPITRPNRTSLTGALSAYVRKAEIFTRPAPNTFGLWELDQQVHRPVASPNGADP